MSHNTSNKTFNDTANSAEAARQAASVPGATQTVVMSADVAYFRSVIKAAVANGISPSVYNQALRSLGWQT